MIILEIFLYLFCIGIFSCDIYFDKIYKNRYRFLARIYHIIFLTPILFLINYMFSLEFPFYDILCLSYVWGYYGTNL